MSPFGESVDSGPSGSQWGPVGGGLLVDQSGPAAVRQWGLVASQLGTLVDQWTVGPSGESVCPLPGHLGPLVSQLCLLVNHLRPQCRISEYFPVI